VYFDNLLAKYQMPWIIGAGAAFKPNQKLTLAMDLEYRNFGSQSVLLRDSLFLDPGGDNQEYFTEIPSDELWKNVFQARAGVEYLTTHSFGRIPLRAGFGYVPSFVPSTDEDGKSQITTSWRISAGTGIWWKQIHLDIAYAYQARDLEARAGSEEFTGTIDEAFWDINNKDHTVRATFTGYF
jgi:long-subunit fatty acid transport protein